MRRPPPVSSFSLQLQRGRSALLKAQRATKSILHHSHAVPNSKRRKPRLPRALHLSKQSLALQLVLEISHAGSTSSRSKAYKHTCGGK